LLEKQRKAPASIFQIMPNNSQRQDALVFNRISNRANGDRIQERHKKATRPGQAKGLI